MKKNDMILIGIITAVALVSYIGISWYGDSKTTNAQAVITVDGEEYGTYPLAEDNSVKIKLEDGSYNMLVIESGMAQISEASCPDKICVHHKPIDKNGETLVCLPNKVVVEIKNAEEPEVDTSTY